MKGEVSSYIIVIGILVLSASMLTAAGVYLDSINLPLQPAQAANGSAEQISGELAEMADQCWIQSDQGQTAAAIDCFEITVEASETVSQDQIREQIETMPSERVELTETITADRQTTLHISYNPDQQNIIIESFAVCEPGTDTCEDDACSCGQDQYCAPESADANDIGCVDEFELELPTNPCESEWCS